MSETKKASASPKHAHIWDALCAAQAEFLPVKKAAEGQIGSRRYNYATLDDLLKMAQPILAKHGIVETHTLSFTADPPMMTTHLIHVDSVGPDNPMGEISSQWPLTPPVMVDAEGNPIEPGPQEFGKQITYGRRYTLAPLLGIALEEDDDAAGMQPTRAPKGGVKPKSRNGEPSQATDKQLEAIGKMFKAAGFTVERIGEAIRKTTKGRTSVVELLRVDEASRVIDRLKDILDAQRTTQEPPEELQEVDPEDTIPMGDEQDGGNALLFEPGEFGAKAVGLWEVVKHAGEHEQADPPTQKKGGKK